MPNDNDSKPKKTFKDILEALEVKELDGGAGNTEKGFNFQGKWTIAEAGEDQQTFTRISFVPVRNAKGTYNIYVSKDEPGTLVHYGTIACKNGEYKHQDIIRPKKKSTKQEPPSDLPTPQQESLSYNGPCRMVVTRDDEKIKAATGIIMLIGADGDILWEGKYKSGNHGKGAVPHIDCILHNDIETFTTAGKPPRKQRGLRIDDTTYENTKPKRTGILIHDDQGKTEADAGNNGTLGCFGIQRNIEGFGDWKSFEKTWEQIDRNHRPSKMEAIDQEKYRELKEAAKKRTSSLPTTGHYMYALVKEAVIPHCAIVLDHSQSKPFSDGFKAPSVPKHTVDDFGIT